MSNRGRFGAAAQEVRAGLFELHNFSGPLHEQVRGLILCRIERGDWPAGTPIPPEVQLASAFGVSIGTVRKALDQLARDRILVRERLKAGDSDKQVIDYIVSRYGEFVLLKPRFEVRTMLLWGAPVLLLLAGGLFVFRASRAAKPAEADALTEQEKATLETLLKQE
ncbi:MAG: cytochrome c-type biogenesis protein CcmH [Hyphomicrobium sp.]|nr:cytochrome c-type biogenesis protein CcmH [Hyphomicrobium sp.]